MGSLSFMVSKVKTLKVIGRKRVTFHLDQLVIVQKFEDQYLWFCRLAEANPYEYGTGVACDGHGFGYFTQFTAEEDALAHICNVHRGMGGERKDKHRGQARRALALERWNVRRLKEAQEQMMMDTDKAARNDRERA